MGLKGRGGKKKRHISGSFNTSYGIKKKTQQPLLAQLPPEYQQLDGLPFSVCFSNANKTRRSRRPRRRASPLSPLTDAMEGEFSLPRRVLREAGAKARNRSECYGAPCPGRAEVYF